MKKLILSVFFLLICVCTNAQDVLLDTASLVKKQVFRSLEEALKTPMKVYRLDLKGKDLSELSKEIAELKNLQILDVSSNILTTLPKEIGGLENLQELNLSGNKLTALPSEIGELKKLKS